MVSRFLFAGRMIFSFGARMMGSQMEARSRHSLVRRPFGFQIIVAASFRVSVFV